MDLNTQKFIQQLRSVKLSKTERAASRAALESRIRAGVPAQPILSPWSWVLSARRFKMASLSLIIIMSYGSTMTLAAENALPGDPLYPVKRFVAEPLKRLTVPNTPAAQASFETGLLNERLQEAETLDNKKKLDAPLAQTVREAIRAQNTKAQRIVRTVAEEGSRAGVATSTAETHSIKQDGTQGVPGKMESENDAERALNGVLKEHKNIIQKLDLSSEKRNGKENEKSRGGD